MKIKSRINHNQLYFNTFINYTKFMNGGTFIDIFIEPETNI